MAIDNVNLIDDITADEKYNYLCLLIADHLKWNGSQDTISERAHIIMLEKKIDAYMDYLESGKYKELYPNEEFESVVIEIHFRYEAPKKCMDFLQAVQDQVKNNGVIIETYVG